MESDDSITSSDEPTYLQDLRNLGNNISEDQKLEMIDIILEQPLSSLPIQEIIEQMVFQKSQVNVRNIMI